MRTVDAKDFDRWIARRKAESLNAFLQRWEARERRRRKIAMSEIVAQRDERSRYYENAVKWLGTVGPTN